MKRDFFPSLRQLRTFAAVARLESISRASAALHLSQSAVTQAVAKLEAELRVPLFVRRNNGTYPTVVGNSLKQRVDRFLASLDDALAEFAGVPDAPQLMLARAMTRRVTRAQILALVAINESGSFLQAAQQVGVSQTSLHRSARSLEDNLGSEIFRNTAHGITTNERGARLADRLLLATRELEWAREEIEAERGVVGGRILIGAMMLAGSYLIASVVNRFASLYPDAAVDLNSASYEVLLERLRNGSLDFMVGLLKNPPPADDVVEEVLLPDPFVIALRRGHPLTRKAKITREDLAAYDWILPSPTAARRAAYESLWEGIRAPRSNVGTNSLTTIVVLLANSDRMTILTSSELLLESRLGHHLTTLDYRPLKCSAAVGVTTRRDWLPTRLQRTFLDFLRGEADKHVPNDSSVLLALPDYEDGVVG